MIPKIVHCTWKVKDILNYDLPMINLGIRNFIKTNPEWTVVFHDDAEVDEYLRSVLDKTDYDSIKDAHIVAKTDIWRLHKIYQDGGMYLDLDRLCNKKMSDIIDISTQWILPISGDFDFCQDIIISEPQNPVFLKISDLSLSKRKQGESNTYALGPQTYMHALTKHFFNTVIDLNPGIETMKKIKSELSGIPFLKIYTEQLPYKTILYEDDGHDFDHELIKRQLYKKFNIKHWSGQW